MKEDDLQRYLQKLEIIQKEIAAILPRSPNSELARRRSTPCKCKHVKAKVRTFSILDQLNDNNDNDKC